MRSTQFFAFPLWCRESGRQIEGTQTRPPWPGLYKDNVRRAPPWGSTIKLFFFYVGIQNWLEKLNPVPVFSPPKITSAPPWRFPPKIQSCLPLLRGPPITNPLTVKLLTSLWMVPAPYSCLAACPSSCVGTPLLASISCVCSLSPSGETLHRRRCIDAPSTLVHRVKHGEDDLIYVEDDLGSDDAHRRRDGVSSLTEEELLGAMTALLREMKACYIIRIT